MIDEARSAYVFPIPDVGAGFPLRKPGLTKREMFAAMAMQGLLAAEANVKIMDCAHEAGTGLPTRDLVPIVEQRLARTCVRLADALLAELAKEPTP